ARDVKDVADQDGRLVLGDRFRRSGESDTEFLQAFFGGHRGYSFLMNWKEIIYAPQTQKKRTEIIGTQAGGSCLLQHDLDRGRKGASPPKAGRPEFRRNTPTRG